MSAPRVPDAFPPAFDLGAFLNDLGNAEAKDHAALTDEQPPAPVEPPSEERAA